jgi:rhamnogalacturonyl hydrolase YesR
MQSIVKDLEDSIARAAAWLEIHDYKAYDPGDGNSSPIHWLTFSNLFLERVLQQVVYRAPINLRPLLGIKPHRSTKGMGYIAWAYVYLYSLTGQSGYEQKARWALRWLIANRSPGYSEFCWGNHFPFSSRGGKIPKLEPTIVWSSLIGQAFLEAYYVLRDSEYLDVVASVARWIMGLPRERTAKGACLSYVAFGQSSIHNSNMLGGALLAQVGKLLDWKEALIVAKEAMVYSCTRQNRDGSWFYGEHPMYHWVDNFHTGYNLDSLKRYVESSGDCEFDDCLARGFKYYKTKFIEHDGCPRYYNTRKYPVDIQCAGQSIDTLTFFADRDSESLELAVKVADWAIRHMQAADGHFYYRDLGWAVNKTPMLHWGQGTMLKALAHLLMRLTSRRPFGEQALRSEGVK